AGGSTHGRTGTSRHGTGFDRLRGPAALVDRRPAAGGGAPGSSAQVRAATPRADPGAAAGAVVAAGIAAAAGAALPGRAARHSARPVHRAHLQPAAVLAS